MSFGTNLTRKAQKGPAFVLVAIPQLKVAWWRFVASVITTHVQSFVLISILRGQPRTPPSGDFLGVLNYHLKGIKPLLEISVLFS